MKPKEDAFGQGLWEYFKKKGEGFEIIERDDGYIDALPSKEYFSEFKGWLDIEKKAMKFVKGNVLDIGCGAGRHSLYLQKKGFDVTGIDISPLAIKICKKRGLEKAKVMPITEINKFRLNSFDTIIMLGNNFGLFGSFNRAKMLLKRFYRITSPNALIIAETRDPYITKNPDHLKYHKLNKKRGRMGGQIRFRVRFKKCATKWYDYLFVSKKELKQILDGTGWRIKKFINSKNDLYMAIIKKCLYFKKL